MKYTKPKFDEEWKEALRYREFEKMGKDKWIETANRGEIKDYSDIKNVLNNVDLDYNTLEDDKKKRFVKHFKEGVIELPIAVKFSDTDYDLLGGNTRLAGLILNKKNPKIWVVDMTKKQSTTEQTTDASSGSFEPAMGYMPIIKRKIGTIHNSKSEKVKEEEINEIDSGQYDVAAFAGPGRKDPLKIGGVNTIGKRASYMNKNKIPKWGGPGGVFIKIKDKCKKFPYCNQGDINAIEILKESIEETSKKYGIPKQDIEKIILKEIKKIFI